MRCNACDAELRDGAKFCNKCGAKVDVAPRASPGRRCPKCGAFNPETAQFCRVDGVALVTSPPAASHVSAAGIVSGPAPMSPTSGAAAAARGIPEAEARVAHASQARVVICPRCGASNPLGAKFCRADGTALSGTSSHADSRSEAAIGPTARTIPPDSSQEAPSLARRRTGLLVATAGGLALVLAVLGGWLYWKGHIGNRPASVGAEIQRAVAATGASSVTAAMDSHWVVTLSGPVVGADQKASILALVQAHPSVKGVIDNLEVKASPQEIQQAIAAQLAAAGLTTVQSSVDAANRVTLTGTVDDEVQRRAAMAVAKGVAGFADVIDQLRRSTVARERAVNQMLVASGLRGVRARFIDEQHMTLEGQVQSASDRDRAVVVASEMEPASQVQNSVEVVVSSAVAAPSSRELPAAPAAPQAPVSVPDQVSPSTAQSAGDAVALRRVPDADITGIWRNAEMLGGRSYINEWRIGKDQTGTLGGFYHYGASGCTGALVLQSASPPDFEFVEKPQAPVSESNKNNLGSVLGALLANSLRCGGGALFRVHANSSQSIFVQKVDRSSGKVLASGEVTR